MRHLLAVVVAVAALVTAAFWPQPAEGLAGYYDTNCAQCHGPVRTCDGCHAHGTHGLAGKTDFNVTALASKFSYAPGEDVVVTVTGGYRSGWVRMLLLDQAQNQVARASGPGGLGNGPDLGAPGGIVLRAPAPTQPGVYTWYAAWYGNKFDLTEAGTGTTTFGPQWKDGPGASHGRELVPFTFMVNTGGPAVAALGVAKLDFPRVAAGATRQLTTQIQNSGAGVLTVSSIGRCASSSAWSWSPSAPFNVAPGASVTLTVTYQPLASQNDAGCLQLNTNASTPVTQLDLTGAADPAPAGTPFPSFTATALDFGNAVSAGTYVQKTFDLQSIGTANLQVTNIATCLTNSSFRFTSPLPGVVAPGEARTVTVYYTPTGATTDRDCLALTTNAGTFQVSLSGAAVMPALTCTSCHGGSAQNVLPTDPAAGMPPTDTAGNSDTTRVTVGAHASHLGTKISPTTAKQAADCTACHESVKSFTDPSHNDGSVDVPFGGVAKAQGANPNWDPKTPSCATTYCHGATFPNAGGTNTNPTWTNVGAGEAACGKCHGVPPPPESGHVAVTGGLTACASCHPDTMAADGTILPDGKHIDGIVQAAGCTSCHGSSANPAPPRDTTGNSATTFVGVGAHQSHVTANAIAAPIACTECHGSQVTSYDAGHKNGTVDINFGSLANNGGASTAWDHNAATCATSYCHGGGGTPLNSSGPLKGGSGIAPQWTRVDGSQATCGSCHGFPPPAPHSQSTNCNQCHPGTVNADGTINLAGGLHLNGALDVANLTCTSCHGTNGVNPAPPQDTKGNTLVAAVGVGAHQKHVVDTAYAKAIACTECHGSAAASYSTTHSDGVVQVTFGSVANQGTTTTWTRASATCAASYCHAQKGGSATTPVWTTVDGTQATCGSCHGAPPPSSIGHPVTTAGCSTCHPATVKADGTIDVAGGKHVDGSVEIDYTAMTCSSCHGTAGRTGSDPFIAAAPPNGTKGETATTTRAVGAHMAHLQAGALANAFACTDCHTPPTSNNHSNGTVELSWSALAKGTGAPAWNGTSCATTYCHGNFKNGNATNAPVWTGGTAQVACGSCHGTPPAGTHPANASACQNCHDGYTATTVNAATHVDGIIQTNLTCTSCHGTTGVNPAPPMDTKAQSSTTLVSVGAHQAHVTTSLRAPIDCTECHGAGAATYTTSHSNNVVDVAFGALSNTGTTTVWTHASATCASNYCHGGTTAVKGGAATTPVWNRVDGTQKTCGSCHGNPPPSSAGHVQRTDCGTCHPGYTNSSVNVATHLDGKVDYIGTLGCTSCHGSASLVAVAGADANVKAAPPVDTRNNSATTFAGVGVHQAHVNGSRSKPVACAECHSGAIPTTPVHATGTTVVAFGTLARTGAVAPAYTGGSCATTYCHGNFPGGTPATPTWTAAGSLACNACHGNPPALPHPQDTSCADCHGAGYSQTTVNAATHVDGAITLNGTTHVAGTCTACHGDNTRLAVTGADANLKASPPIGSKGETLTTARAVGAHASHLNQTTFRAAPIACSECHPVPAPGDKSHANGSVAVAFGAIAKTGGLTGGAWNGANCSNVYCHGGTTGGSIIVQGGANTAPAWAGTYTPGTSTLGCTSCHGAPPTANGHPQRTDCGSCHTGYSNTSVNASLHINGTIDIAPLTCTSCHGSATLVAVAGADANVKAAPPIDSKNNSATTFVGVGVHQAHVNGGRSKPVACAACHTVPTTPQHETGTVNVTFAGLATTGGVTPAYTVGSGGSCAATYCHGNFSGGNGATSASPTWVTAGTLNCTACHGTPPALPHPQDSACGDCHGLGYSLSTVNAATHIDGSVTLVAQHSATAANGCAQCHGDATRAAVAGGDAATPAAPPISSKGESATTQRGVGAHQAHLTQTTFRSAPIACAECHTVPATGDRTHVNGTAAVAFGALARTGNITGGAWNGTACSNVYCHGGTTGGTVQVQGGANTAPAWAGAFTAGTSSLSCSSCHGAPPTANGHPQRTDCGSCHPNAPTLPATSYNAATHINGAVDVLPLGCTTCHGDKTRVAVANADANFAAAPPVDTKNNTLTTAVGVGVHQVHVNGSRSKPVACAECHSGAVPTSPQHENGVVTVAFGTLAKTGGITTAAYTAGGGSCAATYCHGNFSGGNGATSASPGWIAAGTLGCASCHGNPPALPHPQDTSCADCHGAGYSQTTVNPATHVDGAVTLNGTTHVAGTCTSCHGDNTRVAVTGADANLKASPPIGSKGETATTARAVGAHASHLNQSTFRSAPIACTECHTVPAAGDKTHANGTAAVAFGTLAKTGGLTGGAWNGTACSNVYCHGGTTGGTVQVQGGAATAPVWAGTYTAGASTLGCGSCHGAPPTANGHPQRTDCGSCHPSAPSLPATSYTAATHINGTVDVLALTCTTCHGNASLVAVSGADANVRAAPPVDTKGGAAVTSIGVGAHQVHVNGSRSKPVACAECHVVPTTAQHENGLVNMAWGSLAAKGGVTPAYTLGSGASCSATYCHGNFTGGAGTTSASPLWTSTAGTLGCTSCHGIPPTANGHPTDTNCADCHGAGYSTTTVNAATHVDGAVTLVAQHSATAAGGCAQCHGDATRVAVTGGDANTAAAPPISSKGESLTTQRGVGAHQSHIGQKTLRAAPIGCAECHTVPAAGDRTHANGTVNVAFGALATTGGAAPAWNTTGLSCSATYCHGNFPNGGFTPPPSTLAPTVAPTGVAFATVTSSSLSVSWTAVSGATSYKVERAPDSAGTAGTFVQIGTSATIGYDDAALSASTTYWYRVRATNDGGDGPYSTATSQATAAPTSVAAPTAAPTGLSFSAVTTSSLTLSWSSVTGATSYEVDRAPDNAGAAGTFVQIGTSSGTSYADAALNASTTYWYRVRATNDGGDGPNSTSASRTTTAPAPTAAPTGLAFSNVTAASLTLGWSSVTNATSYKIERAPNNAGTPGTFAQIGTSSGTSYADAALTASTTYWYRVRATSNGGDGPYSANASQATLVAGAGIATRYDVAPATATSVGLDGTTDVTTQTSYDYNSSAGPTPHRALGVAGYTLSGTQGRLRANTTLTANTTYTVVSLYTPALTAANNVVGANVPVSIDYYVRTGATGSSATIRATLYEYNDTTGNVGAALGTFTSASISTASTTSSAATASGTFANAAFTAAAGDRLKVVFQVTTGATGGQDLALLFGATGTGTLGDTFITPSLGGSAAPTAPTSTPTNLAFSAVSQTTMTMSWSAVGGATHYKVERAPDVSGAAGTFAQVGTTATTSFGAAGLTPNTRYWFRVRAWNAGGDGPYSANATQTTAALTAAPSAAPTALVFSAVAQRTLTVGWTAATGATFYKVERAPDVSGAAGTFAQVGTTSSTSYGDAGLAAGTKYWYRVRGWNTGGDGPYSSTATQTTTAPTVVVAPSAAPGTPTFSSAAQTTLSVGWTAVTGATHYKVERAPDVAGAAGTFAQIGTTAATSYGDAGLTANTKYWYRVRAWNSGGDGPYSANATQTTAAPTVPTGGGIAWTGTFTAGSSTLNCQSCHGTPPGGTHPTLVAGTNCGSCHGGGYNAVVGATTGTVDPALHMNGKVDGGSESAGGVACSGCHSAIYTPMLASSTKASKHTLGSDAAADLTATAWNGTNLAAVATTGRSCVSMCHEDHPHTVGSGTTHNTNVYADATTSTTRATAGARLATDFDATQASGGLCTSCHQKPVDAANPAAKPAVSKATFQSTAHDFKAVTVGTTTYTWQYTLHDGSPFQRDCTKCHASQAEGQTPTVAADGSGTVGPHSSDFGSLLAGNVNPGTTAASLICFNCHGNGTIGKNMSGKDIATDAAKAQGHGPSIDSSTAHNTANEAAATYNSGAYSGANRHANCLDCHDEHMAGKTRHTPGPNDGAIAATSPLYGASGVSFTGTLPASWTAIPSTNLAKVAVATAEYQICFKCHTGWAFGTTPPTGPSGLAETDLAQEFNPNNKAGHPVVSNQGGATSVKALATTQLLAPWNTNAGNQTMTCTDCHNTDAATTAAQGPHGSAVTFMLTGTNKAWPYTVAGATSGTLYKLSTSETNVNTAGGNGLFCRNCHPQQNNANSNSLHRNSNLNGGQHGGNATIPACVSCHLRIPHGGKVSRLLVTTNAPARYKVGTSNFAQITKGATKDSYSTSSFPSGFKSSCSEHSSGTGSEAW